MTGAVFTPRALQRDKLNFEEYFQTARHRLVARFAAGAKYRLIEEYGPGSFTAEPDGTLLFVRDFAGYEAMRSWVMSFGSRAMVIAPGELRRDIARQAREILEACRET